MQWETLKGDFYALLLSSTSEIKEEIKRWKDYTKRSDASDSLAALAIVSHYKLNVKMHIPNFYLLSRKVIQQFKVLKKPVRRSFNRFGITLIAPRNQGKC